MLIHLTECFQLSHIIFFIFFFPRFYGYYQMYEEMIASQLGYWKVGIDVNDFTS